MAHTNAGKMRCEGYGPGGRLSGSCRRRAHVGLTLPPSPYPVALCYDCAAAAAEEGRAGEHWADPDARAFTRRFFEQVMNRRPDRG